MVLCLVLSPDCIQQWIASTHIIQDRWIWDIYIFPDLCTAVHKAFYHTLVHAKLWNEIPVKIQKAESVETFKEKLKQHYVKIQNEK